MFPIAHVTLVIMGIIEKCVCPVWVAPIKTRLDSSRVLCAPPVLTCLPVPPHAQIAVPVLILISPVQLPALLVEWGNTGSV